MERIKIKELGKQINDYGYTICNAIEERFNDERYTNVRCDFNIDNTNRLRISIEDDEDMFNNVYISLIGRVIKLNIVYYSLDSYNVYLTDDYDTIRNMDTLIEFISNRIYCYTHDYYKRDIEQ